MNEYPANYEYKVRDQIVDEIVLNDIKKGNEEEENKKNSAVVEKTDEIKEIAGYKCRKYKMTTENGPTELYATDKIRPENDRGKYGHKDVKGFPLMIKVTTTQSGASTTMTMVATKVDKSVKDNSIFDLKVPEGYEEKTMDDLKSIGGQ